MRTCNILSWPATLCSMEARQFILNASGASKASSSFAEDFLWRPLNAACATWMRSACNRRSRSAANARVSFNLYLCCIRGVYQPTLHCIVAPLTHPRIYSKLPSRHPLILCTFNEFRRRLDLKAYFSEALLIVACLPLACCVKCRIFTSGQTKEPVSSQNHSLFYH